MDVNLTSVSLIINLIQLQVLRRLCLIVMLKELAHDGNIVKCSDCT
jgi:hypothetical protein